MTRALVLIALLPLTAAAADRPMSGNDDPAFVPLDRAVQKFMDRIGATAAAVAVSREGDLLYSRGYGWQNQARSKKLPPDALFRLASLSKPITAAAVKAAVRDGSLDLDARVLPLWNLKIASRPTDARFKDITVRHLLEHKSGWGTDPASDPAIQPTEVRKVFRLSRPVTAADTVAYALRDPLAFPPGTKTSYSNIGYVALGRVLEGVKKKPFGDCLTELVLKPSGTDDIRPGTTLNRTAREAWSPGTFRPYTLEGADAAIGLIGSAPAVAKFLSTFWATGDLRTNSNLGGFARHFGSIPGAMAMVVQRRDGVNLVALFNNRREQFFPADNEILQEWLDTALADSIK